MIMYTKKITIIILYNNVEKRTSGLVIINILNTFEFSMESKYVLAH